MYAVLRSTPGKKAYEVASVLEQRKAEMGQLLRLINGFVSYSLVCTEEGTISVSVFRDKACAKEGIRVQLDWIKNNAPDLEPPGLAEGPVLISIVA